MKRFFSVIIMAVMLSLSLYAQTEQTVEMQKDIQGLVEQMQQGQFKLPFQIGDVMVVEKVGCEDKTIVVELTLLHFSEFIPFIQRNPQVVGQYIQENISLMKEQMGKYFHMITVPTDLGFRIVFSDKDKSQTAKVEFTAEEVQWFMQKMKE